jgi:hypothetical protein
MNIAQSHDTFKPSPAIYTDPASLHRQLEQLRRENAAYRGAIEDIERLLTKARKWSPNAVKVAIAYRLESLRAKERYGDRAFLKLRQEDRARKYGLSRPTLSNVEKQLAMAGLIEIIETEPILTDPYGNEVDRRTRRTDVQWRNTVNPVVINPYPKTLPVELPTTDQQTKNRQRAQELRELAAANEERLQEMARELVEMPCPHCGKVGELHIRCSGCGGRVEIDDEAPGVSIVLTSPTLTHTDEDEALISATSDDGQEALSPPPLSALPSPPEPAPVSKLLTDLNSVSIVFTRPDPPPAPLTTEQVADWLSKRLGWNPVPIVQQNRGPLKYTTLDQVEALAADGGRVNIAAYLAGDPLRVYGSRPRLSGDLTWLLCFDYDGDEGQPLDAPDKAAMQLAEAGAAAVVWERGKGKAHVELYFDEPVNPEAARAWCEAHAPALKWADECFPTRGQSGRWKDTANQGLSWPLTRLVGRYGAPGSRVVSCPMRAYHPDGTLWESSGWLEGPGPQYWIREALAHCVTPAALIPEPAEPAAERQSPPLSASPVSPRVRPFDSEVRAAIAWWKSQTTEEEVFRAYTGKWARGYFSVRPEKVPSCRRDKDGYGEPMFTDFGDGNRKLDLFDLYCIFNGLDKREEIKRVVEEYRRAHGRVAVAAD